MHESNYFTITTCLNIQFYHLKTNKNMEFHHSFKTDNSVYTIY